MFWKFFLRFALLSSYVFLAPLSKALAEDSSSCDVETANRVLNFGAGFGMAQCKDPNQRGLVIFDRNISSDKDGALVLIVSQNAKLIDFWVQLYFYGVSTDYYTRLLELGRNYYKQSNDQTLKELRDYIDSIQKKLDSPHGNNTKLLKCESFNREDQFCETGLDLTDVIQAQISVSELYSRDKCILNESFKLWGTDLLVEKGCRATFTIRY
jgi:hypothetical protein